MVAMIVRRARRAQAWKWLRAAVLFCPTLG